MFESIETISNPLAEPLEVWFEPWGTTHTLAPGPSFRIVAVSEERGELEVVRDGANVAVHAWPGSTMRVYCGDLLVEDFSIKFPDLPPGMSTRSFIGFMFGGPGGPDSTR
jgi:hypothetical protein